MPLDVATGQPTLFIRKPAFERAGLARQAFDERLNLTPDEFRVEGELVAIGPIYDEDALGEVVAELEEAGLVYFEDFFELSGNWPAWLRVLAMSART
ncbi:MAG TPA: hypothetical protein VFS08_03350 [Gemmatimonadaceae bacterium]|nr:hypothetical protein [Gemmatimonadaceae bacterium]